MSALLTARQAAKLFGVVPRTAQRRAQEAALRGDPEVVRIGQAWTATEAWWRAQLQPRSTGRPRKAPGNEPADRAGPDS